MVGADCFIAMLLAAPQAGQKSQSDSKGAPQREQLGFIEFIRQLSITRLCVVLV